MSILISKYTIFDELRHLLKEIKDACFVVPTSQDSEWLLDLAGYENDCLFISSKTHVWNDLYREFAARIKFAAERKVFRQIDPPDNRLILKYIVNELIRKKNEVLKELPGIVHSGYMELLSESIGELISEEVLPEIYASTIKNTDLAQHILIEIYNEYLIYLDRYGLMDSAQIPTRIRELLEGNSIDIKGENFVFVGFHSFTNAQKNLIESMSNSGAQVKLIQPEAFVDGMYDVSVQFSKYRVNNDNISQNYNRDYILYESPDSSCELDLLARELALWSRKSGAFAGKDFMGWGSIGILTSQARIKMLHEVLSRYNIPVNTYMGVKVSETPLGYLPKKLYSAYKNGWQAKDTAILLSHACLGGSISDPAMIYRGPFGENGWMKHMSDANNTVGIKAFNAMNVFCKAIDNGGNPVKILNALLEFSQENGLWLDSLYKLTIHNYLFDSELRELSSAIIELERKLLFMKELQPSVGIAGNQVFKGYAAIEFLNQWSSDSQTAINPIISGAVSVYSKIPSLANFDTIIITGVTAKEWPGNLSNLSIINEQSRERINEYNPAANSKTTHLMTLHEKRIQKLALLKRLFYSAERLTVISRPLADDKNRPLLESSSLISALRSEDFVNIGVIRKNFRDLLPENSPYFAQIEVKLDHTYMNKRIMPEAISTNENNIVKMSALDELVECPYLYWAKHIKKIKEPVTELYNNLFAGNLVHELMETAWREKLSSNRSLCRVVSFLWDVADNNDGVFLKYKDLFIDKRLMRRKNLLRAKSIRIAGLQDEIEERMNLHSKKRLDIKFEYEISFEAEGFIFIGRCDRLDIFEDGAAIIDYKTGKIPSSMLQLGTYAKALKINGFEIVGAGYVSLKEDILKGIFIGPYSNIYTGREAKKSVDELLCDTERKISYAVESLKMGKFTPNFNSKLCGYCSYKPICRFEEFGGKPEDDV